jgi:mono/diheme cytochrome c family protein
MRRLAAAAAAALAAACLLPPRAGAEDAPAADRGQALIEAMGCAGCHDPAHGPAWSGIKSGGWLAPNITPDPVSGVGAWSRAELVRYLRTGRASGRGEAGGPMAGVVEGMRETPDADIEAAAGWLSRLPPVRDPADTAPATSRGEPGSAEDVLRGAPSAQLARAGFRLLQANANAGAELFSGNCAACHGRDGGGSPDGLYPSLWHNSAVGRGDPTNLIAAVLWGVRRRAGTQEAYMPAFGRTAGVAAPLGDEEIAAVVNYVLLRFGDPAAAKVTGDAVAAARGVR